MLSSQDTHGHSITYMPDRSRGGVRPVINNRSRREVTLRSITFTKNLSEQRPTTELGDDSSVFRSTSPAPVQDHNSTAKARVKRKINHEDTEEEQKDELNLSREEGETSGIIGRDDGEQLSSHTFEEVDSASQKDSEEKVRKPQKKRTSERSSTSRLNQTSPTQIGMQTNSEFGKRTSQQLHDKFDLEINGPDTSLSGKRSSKPTAGSKSEIDTNLSPGRTKGQQLSGIQDALVGEPDNDTQATPQSDKERDASLQLNSSLNTSTEEWQSGNKSYSTKTTSKIPPVAPSKLSKRKSLHKQKLTTDNQGVGIDSYFLKNNSCNSSPVLGIQSTKSPPTKRIRLSGTTEKQPALSKQSTPAMMHQNITLGTSHIGLPEVTSTPRVHGKMTQRPRLSGLQTKLMDAASTPGSGPAIRRTKLLQHSNNKKNAVTPQHSEEETHNRPSKIKMQKSKTSILQKKLPSRMLMVKDEGGTVRGADVTDLDVLLESIHKKSTTFIDRHESKVCRKSVALFLDIITTEISETVNKVQKLKKKKVPTATLR